MSACVKGFGRRPSKDGATGTWAVVGKPPVKEPAGMWASRCFSAYGD